jgi:hypothetical protein
MSAPFAAGWRIVHLSDRKVMLQKDDPVYLKIMGMPGFVTVRAEPGMDRAQVLDIARSMAERNDIVVSKLVAKQVAPNLAQLVTYQNKLRRLKPTFDLKGKEETRVYAP